jgi:hypothetical protein
MANEITGGCACSEVRYRLAATPFDVGWCHCRTCQLSSGTPAIVFGSLPRGDLIFEQGEDKLRIFRSSSFGRRRFCGECGTLLTMEVEFQPETIDIAVATLDRPGDVPPRFHIFFGSHVPWFDPADSLPRHDRYRATTRGLAGTEPPA